MRNQKNATARLLLPISALALLAACASQVTALPPGVTPIVTLTPTHLIGPTPTCSWGWRPYTGKEIPDWTSAWKEALSETDLEASELKVEGVGETSVRFCDGKTTESWGMVYQEIQATILVDDVKNLDILGNTLVKVYQAVNILTTNERDLAKARLLLLFRSRKDENEVVRRDCNHNLGIPMMKQGKSGKELFEVTCSE